MSETTATAKNICSYCHKPFEGFHICGNTFVPPAGLMIDPAAARLQEIRDLWEDFDWSLHGSALKGVRAVKDIRYLLDQLQSAHARAATLEQQLAEARQEAYQADRAYRKALGEPL
jgi:hypothetical protein